MKNVIITIGTNVCAYADIEVEVSEAATKDEILAAVRSAQANAEATKLLVYTPDWTTQSSFRVVGAQDDDVNVLVQGAEFEEVVSE